ncbi:sigma 54-interacting transcriptional regulator [Thiomicrorhabdus sp. Kp2]|uniref:sigma-54-dependent Fis family transcriptional regulator n=1 Tax=Thiomicrorhabdus sp. Kp2 TaxID=1123518 RepID=UPI0004286BA9|nr:sigma 54-interacting transcriptional regulator [Thiomicrorhabdus sp. Kp2]
MKPSYPFNQKHYNTVNTGNLVKEVEHLDIANHSEYIVIKEAAEQIENAYEPQKAIRTILSLISRQMGLNRGRILLQDGDSGYLYTAYSYGLTQEEIDRSRFAMSEGISGKVMYTGTPTIVSDIDKEEDYLFRTVDRDTLPAGKVSFIATPITRNNIVIGVLAVNRMANPRRSLDKELGLLKLIALFISEILAVHAMIEKQTQILKEENEQLRSMALGQGSQYGIIGESPALMSALNKVSRATNTSVTVMLQGESGTGKERFSRMLHLASHRKDGPFIAINCAAIPEELLESELFGHEKGAFTGAIQTKLGKMELANHGTLFLDEIGDMDLGLQSKLLRVLEDRTITRIGATKPIPIDIRIIVASHKDLHGQVNNGAFRLDLFYRLNVFPIELPALRERDGDIRLLARHFLNQANQEYGTSAIFDPEAMTFLERYDWPGNIRQLENIVKRAVLMADNNRLISANLINRIISEESGIIRGGSPAPEQIAPVSTAYTDSWQQSTAIPQQPVGTHAAHQPAPPTHEPYPPQSFIDSVNPVDEKRAYWRVSENETERLQQALEMARGNKTRAAMLLNMTPRQFNYRLKKLGIEG